MHYGSKALEKLCRSFLKVSYLQVMGLIRALGPKATFSTLSPEYFVLLFQYSQSPLEIALLDKVYPRIGLSLHRSQFSVVHIDGYIAYYFADFLYVCHNNITRKYSSLVLGFARIQITCRECIQQVSINSLSKMKLTLINR